MDSSDRNTHVLGVMCALAAIFFVTIMIMLPTAALHHLGWVKERGTEVVLMPPR